MKIEHIKECFIKECQKWENKDDVLYAEFETEKWACVFSLYFRMIKIQFVYCWKWENLAPPSVLYCRIFPNKNIPVYLHFPELFVYLGVDEFRACYFPYIETTKRMEDCFEVLSGIVKDYLQRTEELCADGNDIRILEYQINHNFFGEEEITDEHRNPLEEEDMEVAVLFQTMFENLMVARHTNLDAYDAYIKGDWKESLGIYKKIEKRGVSEYEKRLCLFMLNEQNQGFKPMPDECMAVSDYNRKFNDKIEWKGIGLAYVPTAIILCLIIIVINLFFSFGTIYYSEIPLWYAMIAALPTAIFGYHAFKRNILKLLNKEKIQEGMEFYELTDNHPWIDRLAKALCVISILGFIVFAVNLSEMSLRCYDDYVLYYSEEESVEGFNYEEVNIIYYINARYNEDGDRIERPSYVLELEDGEQIDLDSCLSRKEQEKVLHDLFSSVKIIELDSDKEL